MDKSQRKEIKKQYKAEAKQKHLLRLVECDNAYIKVDGSKATLVRGEAYIWRKDQEKEKLEEGKLITL